MYSEIKARLTPAVFDYFLDGEAPTLRMEILDSEGAVVRTYLSDSSADPSRSGGRRRAMPSRDAGLNRFTWDQRYEPATVFPGMTMWVGTPDGPVAAPGRYRVRVSANGVTRAQAFEIVGDPLAVDVTDDDVRAQFDLALSVRDRISEANEAVITIRDLRSQMQDRLGRTADREVRSAGESLAEAIGAIEERLYQVRLRSQLDAITYPIRLNNQLANLKLSIETGDGKPTPQHYAAYEQLSSELAVQLAELATLTDGVLNAFNGRLAELGLPTVSVKR